MDGILYVCGISKLCVLNPVLVESVSIKSMLRPMEHFSLQLTSIVITTDSDVSLNAIERLHPEPDAVNRQASLFHRCLWTFWVVMVIVCATTRTEASEYFTESVKQVCTFNVLYEGKLIGAS